VTLDGKELFVINPIVQLLYKIVTTMEVAPSSTVILLALALTDTREPLVLNMIAAPKVIATHMDHVLVSKPAVAVEDGPEPVATLHCVLLKEIATI